MTEVPLPCRESARTEIRRFARESCGREANYVWDSLLLTPPGTPKAAVFEQDLGRGLPICGLSDSSQERLRRRTVIRTYA